MGLEESGRRIPRFGHGSAAVAGGNPIVFHGRIARHRWEDGLKQPLAQGCHDRRIKVRRTGTMFEKRATRIDALGRINDANPKSNRDPRWYGLRRWFDVLEAQRRQRGPFQRPAGVDPAGPEAVVRTGFAQIVGRVRENLSDLHGRQTGMVRSQQGGHPRHKRRRR